MKAIRCLLFALSALSTLTHAEHFNAFEQPSKPRRSLRSAAVVGGSSVSSGYDYIALIASTFSCTGSLIAPTKVLTAAHCCREKANAYTVVLGAYKLKHDILESFDDLRKEGKAVRDVSAVAYPSQYNNQAGSPYDVCVMTLSTAVTTITPVTIAAASNAKNANVMVDSTVRVLGWGLQSSSPVSQLKAVDITTGTCPAQKSTGFICYSETFGGQCQGDSGGPVLAKPPGSTAYALYGTVSYHTVGDKGQCQQDSSALAYDILTGTPAILKFIQSA